MTRIAEKFAALEGLEQKGFIPFITAGDPDAATSVDLAVMLAARGAAVIELGVPFSDPMADGPTIQRSSMRALERGTDFAGVLEIAARIRSRTDVPIVLFTYYNPLLKFGIDNLCCHCDHVDGVLLTDVIDNEARIISDQLSLNGIDLISLVAPTTSEQRLKEICGSAGGFIYAVSRTGVTGARNEASARAEPLVARIRQYTDLPIAVGFGISTPEQIASVWRYADAAVVGSAIVAEIERNADSDNVTELISSFVTRLLPQVAKTGSEN